MTIDEFYMSQAAYERQCEAARKAKEAQQSQPRSTPYDNGNVVDAEFYEVDSVAGLIEFKAIGIKDIMGEV